MKMFTLILTDSLNPYMLASTAVHVIVSALIFPKYIPEQGFCGI